MLHQNVLICLFMCWILGTNIFVIGSFAGVIFHGFVHKFQQIHIASLIHIVIVMIFGFNAEIVFCVLLECNEKKILNHMDCLEQFYFIPQINNFMEKVSVFRKKFSENEKTKILLDCLSMFSDILFGLTNILHSEKVPNQNICDLQTDIDTDIKIDDFNLDEDFTCNDFDKSNDFSESDLQSVETNKNELILQIQNLLYGPKLNHQPTISIKRKKQ